MVACESAGIIQNLTRKLVMVVQHHVIPALRRLKQEDHKACLGFLGSYSMFLAVRTLFQKAKVNEKTLILNGCFSLCLWFIQQSMPGSVPKLQSNLN